MCWQFLLRTRVGRPNVVDYWPTKPPAQLPALAATVAFPIRKTLLRQIDAKRPRHPPPKTLASLALTSRLTGHPK